MKDKISQLFVQAGGFRDLEVPEIITSGELVIYYCNTEKLLFDNGKWEDYGNNSLEMINHACNIERVFPEFREVIDAIVEIVKPLLNLSEKVAISGGQRRDWIFSGPVARRLKVPHISVYKNGEIEIHEDTHLIKGDIEGFKTLHISDLVTKGKNRTANRAVFPFCYYFKTPRPRVLEYYSLCVILCFLRHSSIFLWSPDSNTLGTLHFTPFLGLNTSGRV